MQPSMEIRWFIEGEIPMTTKDWFHQGRTEQAEVREDWYLSLPNMTDVGIKIRGGETEDGQMPPSKIEVKKRILDQGMQTLADGSAGQVEQRFKWSFKAADQKDIMKEMTQSDGQWISVGKERWLRKYAVNEEGSVQFVSPGTTVAQGCSLELTGIQVVGNLGIVSALKLLGRLRRSNIISGKSLKK